MAQVAAFSGNASASHHHFHLGQQIISVWHKERSERRMRRQLRNLPNFLREDVGIQFDALPFMSQGAEVELADGHLFAASHTMQRR